MNLYNDPWIMAILPTGEIETVSARQALLKAHTYVGVYDHDPLHEYGIYRWLTCLVTDLYRPTWAGDIDSIQQAGQFEREYSQVEEFDLLGGYGQSPIPTNLDSVARLFLSLPTGRDSTHFIHRNQDEHAICLPCIASAICRMSAYTVIGGKGYGGTVNQGTPFYVLPVGNTLFDTLVNSLTVQENYGEPAWRMADSGSATIGSISYLHWLSFIPRRFRLLPEATHGVCTRCGQETTITVSRIYWGAGLRPTEETRAGIVDPFVAYSATGRAVAPYLSGYSSSRDWAGQFARKLADAKTVWPRVLVSGITRYRLYGAESDQASMCETFVVDVR